MSADKPIEASDIRSDGENVQRGEPSADRIERLFKDHNESLLRFLRTRLHSSQEAKEVAQEAYVHMLGLGDPSTVSFLQGYLFKTAANLATNRLKQRTRRQRIDELVFFETETARSPEHSFAARQDLGLIMEAIAELPARCQDAFLAVTFDDMSVAEAAQALKLHPRRVRRYVARALVHCHEALHRAGRNQGGST